MHQNFQTTTKWSCCSNADFKELYDFGFADCLLACTDAPPTTIPSWATTTATTSGKYIQYVNLSLDKKQFVLTLPVNINAHKLFIMSARITNSLGGVLGSYNPLLIIVIICTVNVPQIKQTNKLKAQISPAVQTIG